MYKVRIILPHNPNKIHLHPRGNNHSNIAENSSNITTLPVFILSPLANINFFTAGILKIFSPQGHSKIHTLSSLPLYTIIIIHNKPPCTNTIGIITSHPWE